VASSLIAFKTQEVQADTVHSENHGHGFWDQKGVLLDEFMRQGTTINAEAYCVTLRRLWRAIQKRRQGLLSSRVMLLHDNMCPHVVARTQAIL
jgi:hypothetical protein